MRFTKTRTVAAVAVIGALAAGGAAFTASNVMPSENVAGYNSIQVTGARISDNNNTPSADGQSITKVVLTSATTLPADNHVNVGFGPAAGTAPTNLDIPCTLAGNGLSATCGDGTTNLAPTASSNQFAVAVNH